MSIQGVMERMLDIVDCLLQVFLLSLLTSQSVTEKIVREHGLIEEDEVECRP